MAKKTYTLMFLPHAEANFKKIQISRNRVISICAAIFLFLALTGYIFYGYINLHMMLADYEETKANEEYWAKLALANWTKVDHSVRMVARFNSMLNQLMKNLNYMGGGSGGVFDFGKGSVNEDKFASVLNDLKQGQANEYLIDFEMKLNQWEKEEDFFNHGYLKVAQAYQEQDELVSQMPSICPADGWRSSGFGYRKDPFTGKRAFHRGLDICNVEPVPVIATADGTVIFTGIDGGFGRAIVINHGLTGFKTRYAHLRDVYVKPNQEVKRGDTIGTMGSSGRSTGIHLHYEVIRETKPLDPRYFILDRDIASRYN